VHLNRSGEPIKPKRTMCGGMADAYYHPTRNRGFLRAGAKGRGLKREVNRWSETRS